MGLLSSFDINLKKIHKLLAKSPKRLQSVKKWARYKSMKFYKISRVYDIRWIAKVDFIQNIRLDYPFLLSAIRELMNAKD